MFLSLVTWRKFKDYRKKHRGPVSDPAFAAWKRNGGKDREGFNWVTKIRKPKQKPSVKSRLDLQVQVAEDKAGKFRKGGDYREFRQYVMNNCNVYMY